MRRPLPILCLLVAWLCANGSLLDMIQVVAWGRMFVGYVQSMSVGDAIDRTFDPGRPCRLCLAVQKARASEKGSVPAQAPPAAVRLILQCDRAEAFAAPCFPGGWPESDFGRAPTRRERVPVPPPKDVVALGIG